MELFKLFGSVFVDTAKADASLSKTEKKADGLATKFLKGTKAAGKFALGLGAMAVTGGAALLGIANETSQTADRVDKLSQKLTMSRRGFQLWDHVMSQSGMSIESLQAGMKKMNGVVDDVFKGNASAIDSFKRLGFSVDDLRGKSPEEIFEMTVAALQEMPEGSERAALANDLLGKSASEMAPILNMTAEETQALKDEALELGLVLSDEAVDAGVVFGDTMANVKDSLSMVVTNVGTAVMPVFQTFLDWVIANMPTIQAVASTVFSAIQVFVLTVVDVFQTYLMPVFQAVYDWAQANWPIIQGIFETAFNLIADLVKAFVDVFQKIWDNYGEHILSFITTIWETIKGVVEGAINAIKGIIEIVTGLISGDWEKVWDGIKNFVSGIWDAIKSYVEGVINVIKEVISSVLNAIKGVFENVWNGISSFISGVIDGISSAISSVFNGISDTISGIWNGIKSTTESIWNGIKDAIWTPVEWVKDKVEGAIDFIRGLFDFEFKWPHIPLPHFSFSGSINPFSDDFPPSLSIEWYAKGGIMTNPTIFGAAGNRLLGGGEAGPEAILPISKLQEMVDWNKGEIDYKRLYELFYSATVKALRELQFTMELDKREIGRVMT